MLLPVPTIAAIEEMLTITASRRLLHQGRECSNCRKRPAHVRGENRVDQLVRQGLQVVMRYHPGKPGGVHEHVAAPILLLDHRSRGADQGRFQHRDPHCLVARSGQFRYDSLCLLGFAVVANNNSCARLSQAPGGGRSDRATPAGDNGYLVLQVHLASLPSIEGRIERRAGFGKSDDPGLRAVLFPRLSPRRRFGSETQSNRCIRSSATARDGGGAAMAVGRPQPLSGRSIAYSSTTGLRICRRSADLAGIPCIRADRRPGRR